MSANNNVVITVGSDHDCLTSAKLTLRIRDNCPQLAILPPGSSLPSIRPKPFQIVLAYLDGDDALSVFTSYFESNTFLLRFAETWALAARLCLPVLQDKLIMIMRDVHVHHTEHGTKRQWPADEQLCCAIQYLREEVGPSSHAENFLICFVGRAAPLICELERQLNRWRFEKNVREKILAEARSFERDPIKHQPNRFMVSVSDLPKYPPLDVQRPPVPNKQVENHNDRRLSDTHSDERKMEANTAILKGPEPNSGVQCSVRNSKALVPHAPETIICSPICLSNWFPNWSYNDNSGRDTPGSPNSNPESNNSSENTPPNDDERHNGPSAPAAFHAPSPPPPPPASPARPNEHDGKAPYIIHVSQHNNSTNHNYHHNSNHVKNGNANGAAIIQDKSGNTGRGKGKHGRHKNKKKGKRFAWFLLLTCGCHDY
jgi:hypothetical protein